METSDNCELSTWPLHTQHTFILFIFLPGTLALTIPGLQVLFEETKSGLVHPFIHRLGFDLRQNATLAEKFLRKSELYLKSRLFCDWMQNVRKYDSSKK